MPLTQVILAIFKTDQTRQLNGVQTCSVWFFGVPGGSQRAG